ncbi:MAG: hypothetical protein PHD02_03235 [Bacilli bacterium]|nr:hypothetical protein [Bacilli bacterium]
MAKAISKLTINTDFFLLTEGLQLEKMADNHLQEEIDYNRVQYLVYYLISQGFGLIEIKKALSQLEDSEAYCISLLYDKEYKYKKNINISPEFFQSAYFEMLDNIIPKLIRILSYKNQFVPHVFQKDSKGRYIY